MVVGGVDGAGGLGGGVVGAGGVGVGRHRPVGGKSIQKILSQYT